MMSCEKIARCKLCTTITTTTCPGIAAIKTTATACGQELKDVDGYVMNIKNGVYTITSRTTCK